MTDLYQEALTVLDEADVLHDAGAVEKAYDELAAQITARYEKLNPVIHCVMNGGLYAMAEITRRLNFPFEMDYFHASRYRGATTGGGLVWKVQPKPEKLSGRHVLVIDDILDEGHTLAAIRAALTQFEPASLAIAVLLRKRHDRCAPGAQAEYIGLEVGDRYVFGCGMDYKEYWRQLPAIYAVKGM